VTDGSTGFLSRDEAEFERRAAQLARDPALRERLGRVGSALVAERFSPARKIDGYARSMAAWSRRERDVAPISALLRDAAPIVRLVTPTSRRDRSIFQQRRSERRFTRHGRARGRGFPRNSAAIFVGAIGGRLALIIE
jgi:hypothetical protein